MMEQLNNQLHQKRLKGNVRKILAMVFCQVFLIIIPVAVPFFQSKGLSMQDVFSLQALFGFIVVLAEVPSGYIADMLGRKRTLILGAFFAGIGHMVLLGAEDFFGLAVFETCLAIGFSLFSGADLAIMYDTELALGRGEARQRQVVGRMFSMRNYSEAAAGVSCGLILMFWTMDMAVALQAIVGWLPFAIALTLIEPPGAKMSGESHVGNFSQILKHLMYQSSVLRLTFLALSVWSLTTFYAVWLLQKLWEIQGIPLTTFGYLWAGLSLVSATAGQWAHRLEARFGARTLLVFIGLAPALGYLGMLSLGVVGALFAATTFYLSRGFGLVLLRDAMNSRVPSQFRATVNSLASFGFRGCFVLTGPWIGYAYDLWGMEVVLSLLAVTTVVIFFTLVLPLVLAQKAEAQQNKIIQGDETCPPEISAS